MRAGLCCVIYGAAAIAMLAAPAAQAEEVDWNLAANAYAAGEAQADNVFTRKTASVCAGRWMLHADAVDDGAFPVEALYDFPAELRLPHAIQAIDFFRMDPMDKRAYRKAADRAERQLRRVLAGDKEAFVTYFAALGQCSTKREAVRDYSSEATDAPAGEGAA